MIMIGLKAFGKLSALALYITAHAGACQEQVEFSACFSVAYADVILVIAPRT